VVDSVLRDQGAGPEASGLEEDLLAECGTRVLKTVTFTLHPSPYTMPPTPYTLHPRPYTLHSTPCTLHPTPFTQDPTPCTLHPAPYTLHPTPYTLHVLTTVRLAPHALTPDTVELPLEPFFPEAGPSRTRSSQCPTRSQTYTGTFATLVSLGSHRVT